MTPCSPFEMLRAFYGYCLMRSHLQGYLGILWCLLVHAKKDEGIRPKRTGCTASSRPASLHNDCHAYVLSKHL